jgi:uncharacterized membrane protein (DUF441 family)
VVGVLFGTLKELLDSKKFVAGITAAATAIIIAYCAKRGIVFDKELADEVVKIIVGSSSAYVISQGVADHGKEKAKEEAKPSSPSPTPAV